MPNSEESNARAALCQQNRLHRELLNISNLAEVVYVVIAAELVKRAELLKTNRVIMVAVDWEDRQLNAMMSWEVVSIGVVLCFEVWKHTLRSEHIPIQNLRSFEVA